MTMKYITTIGDKEYTVEIIDEKHVSLNGQVYEIDFQSVHGQPVYSLLMEGKSYESYVSEDDGVWEVMLLGNLYTAAVVDEREKRLRAASGGGAGESGLFTLKAPMPGLIIAVPVSEGQQVAKGDVLVILESMKMQNELRSPKDGKVTRIKVARGDSVEQKAILLSVE
jgi:biotin carboxyl carrier protein